MGTTCDAKDIAKHRPFAIAIPSTDFTHSRSGTNPYPAYRFYRETKKSHGFPVLNSNHDQQIAALHDLLRVIKEAAVKLRQLIDINERRKDGPDFRYDRQDNPGSELATTSSSVCVLCGITLYPKDSLEESWRFTHDREKTNAYTRDSDITSRDLDSVFSKTNLYKAASPIKIDKRQEEIIPKSRQSADSSSDDLRSKLLFIRRISSDKTACQICESQRRDNQNPKYAADERRYKADVALKPIKLTQQSPKRTPPTIPPTQDASTLTHEMLCPCACGLLTKEIESEVSIESLPMLKEKLIKTKLEELGLYLDSKKTADRKMHDIARKARKTTTQELEKHVNIEHWRTEITQQRLQTQVEELHRNIRFFKQENEYIRCLVEQCRYSSEKTKVSKQLLPITYSGNNNHGDRDATRFHKYPTDCRETVSVCRVLVSGLKQYNNGV
ncbi:uncharacterized protein [Linepithema humile]|uniref:uncharacterized protein isoform X2 n=1 Tax=Linepithema humile TaxID=83485 RepID=UPI00351F41E8